LEIENLQHISGSGELSITSGKTKVAVLAGGIGPERSISIKSGKAVAEALRQAGFDVVLSDITPDDMGILDDDGIDVFFVALHGEFGEDGRIQQILEDKSLCYTGSGPAACRLAFDKMASKAAFAEAGVAVPAALDFGGKTGIGTLKEKLSRLGRRFVVKPIRQGSSVGLHIAGDIEQALAGASRCLSEFGDCMIEQLIDGTDITVGVLSGKALPVIELKTRKGFYDFDAKYTDEQTQFLFDTVKEPQIIEHINTSALSCFGALGCRHFARVDFRVTDDGRAFALEVNAIPGFTARSDLPKAAARLGLSMSQLCKDIVEAALKERLLCS